MEPQIGFCTNAVGARIAYATLGQGSAWVLVPGYFAYISAFQTFPEAGQALQRNARYHTQVFYDMGGTGLSDRNRTVFTLESELRDLETVVDHLKLDRIVLLGNGPSGPVAIAYAAKYPERVTHLVLYGTYACLGKYLSDEVRAAIVSLLRQPDNWAGRRLVLNLAASQAQSDSLELLAALVKEVATPEVAANLMDMVFKYDVRNLCPLVKAPTLVMHRKGDPLVDFKAGLELASLIPNARFVPLEGDMHFSILGDTESIERNQLEFIGDPITDDKTAKAAQPVAGDPVPKDSDTGKAASLSRVAESKPEQKKENWLRMDNPLVFVIFAILASVIAGAILTLFKC